MSLASRYERPFEVKFFFSAVTVFPSGVTHDCALEPFPSSRRAWVCSQMGRRQSRADRLLGHARCWDTVTPRSWRRAAQMALGTHLAPAMKWKSAGLSGAETGSFSGAVPLYFSGTGDADGAAAARIYTGKPRVLKLPAVRLARWIPGADGLTRSCPACPPKSRPKP